MQEAEADAVSTAVINVLRHYGVQTTGKVADFAALAIALGSVYGGRVMHHIAVTKERAAGRAPQGGNVHPFPPPGAQAQTNAATQALGDITVLPPSRDI